MGNIASLCFPTGHLLPEIRQTVAGPGVSVRSIAFVSPVVLIQPGQGLHLHIYQASYIGPATACFFIYSVLGMMGPDIFSEFFFTGIGHSQAFQDPGNGEGGLQVRSEEHTSELQSLMRISYA